MDGESLNEAQAGGVEQQDEWALVEIFGHRRHWGRIIEVERFGAKLLRVDVPASDAPDAQLTSHFYGGGAIFSMTLTDEATARRMNKRRDEPYLARLPAPDHDEQREDELDF